MTWVGGQADVAAATATDGAHGHRHIVEWPGSVVTQKQLQQQQQQQQPTRHQHRHRHPIGWQGSVVTQQQA